MSDQSAASGSSTNEPSSVLLEIAGREYRVRSDANEEWLHSVARAVDDAMSRIRERTDTVDSHDVAVLAALNLARELLQLRQSVQDGIAVRDEGALRGLIELVEAELARAPQAAEA